MPDFSTPHKVCIRERFDKTLIHFLKNKFGCKIIYYGLPSPEAADIICWKDDIDYVVAFQCRDYPNPSSPDQNTEDIDALYQKLSELEASEVIEGFDLYDGYMEEVLFRGIDNSASGAIKYRHEEFVTLFNLDFCNKITSPQKYVDLEGNIVSKYKFELIDKILEYQDAVTKENDKFVLFLTLLCSFDGGELELFESSHVKDLEKYWNSDLSKKDKKHYVLKHFVEFHLSEKIRSKNYAFYFMPTVFYRGINNIEMMHLAILCIRPKDTLKEAGVFPVTQGVESVVNQAPLTPNEECNGLVAFNPSIPGMQAPALDWMSAFISSNTFKRYWKTEEP